MKILVDSDSCPVKDLAYKISSKYNIDILFITSISHYSINSEIDSSHYIYVDNFSEAADIEIMNRLGEDDIVISDDYGLASLVLSKKCYCISSKGYIYNNDNINSLLTRRYLSKEQRKLNKRVKSTNKKREKKDNKKFEEKFIKLICSIRRNKNFSGE
ncbi:YaiI/YqxD family protein [Senegalia massiliensis]|uniref:YaiI/YqxD family protein n=1 Tax=Senegalia massiliensis TaxID=1720316 RepID=UPI001030E228|nr:DUF188 domain-containing protein [Senegalia massiliensis]